MILFDIEEALIDPEVAAVLAEPGATQVIRSFEQVLSRDPAPMVDAEVYRRCVLQVRDLTGLKGKNLFRPVRVAVTGRASGPELERLIPLLEQGSRLDLPVKVEGVRARVVATARRVEVWGSNP
jgi:glutamyl/glutaminyl-tRNA synthetase